MASNPIKNLDSIFKSLASISGMFKGNNKKWSSKRSISGVLCSCVVYHVGEHGGIDMYSCLLGFIAVLPICMTVFEKVNPET